MTDSETEPDVKLVRQAPDDLMYSYACKAISGKYKYKYCIEEDEFYLYKDGYWQNIHELELMDMVNSTIRITHLTINQSKNIILHMKRLTKMRLERFNWCSLFNLKNAMINPYSGESEEHDEIYYSTNRIPYVFNLEDKCPTWIKTLNEIFENDKNKIDLLQEFFGYCLNPEVNQKKALLLLGDSNSGKSTVLNVLRELLGKDNCSSVPLKFLSNPQYTPMLVNKLVNIDADVDKNASNYEAEFKIITSGEPISCNQKFIETFEFIPKCKIILAANIFPKITDHSSAFYKRLILIPCDRIFEEEEQNRNLVKEISKELSGVLNWAIEGLKKLNSRGRFQHHDFMKNAVDKLENDNNPVNSFFEEHVDIVFGQQIEKSELFDKYKSWTNETKNYTLSKEKFSNCVFKRFHKETPKDARDSNGNRPRVWKNIIYVPIKSELTIKQNVGWQE